MLTPWKKTYDQPRQHIKKQRLYFADKGPFSQSYGFSPLVEGAKRFLEWERAKAEECSEINISSYVKENCAEIERKGFQYSHGGMV